MMDYDENSLYFLTARGKGFYDRLKKKGFLALTALKGENTMSSAALSVRGKLSICPQSCIDSSKVPFEIEQAHYLHCGNCMTACPSGAVVRRKAAK